MESSEKKSTFVTVLSWIFIIIGGFSTFIGILQNIMIFFFFPKDELKQELSNPNNSEQIPEIMQFIFSYFDYFFLIALVLFIIVFISAIGLLKRKNWARIIFMGLMSFGILWNIGGIFIQFIIFNSFPDFAGQPPAPADFQIMQKIIISASCVMALAMSGLFFWIIWKLKSEPIKEEFA